MSNEFFLDRFARLAVVDCWLGNYGNRTLALISMAANPMPGRLWKIIAHRHPGGSRIRSGTGAGGRGTLWNLNLAITGMMKRALDELLLQPARVDSKFSQLPLCMDHVPLAFPGYGGLGLHQE